MRQMQSVENPDKSGPGHSPGSGRGNSQDPRPASGQCPEARPHLINRIPGAKLHGPERPNTGQEVAHQRITYFIKL